MTTQRQHQTPTDIIFVVEGTALNGVYLHELKQHYIIPTLEYFAGPIDEKDCGSDSNYCLFGLVVFHASDILPGFVTEAHGPLTTSYQLLAQLDRLQFAGGHGEAAAHVGEGLATALQCLQDISNFRNSAPVAPDPKKHIILVCNCKPYGLPIMESVGVDGTFKGQTAEQLANGMTERDVHLSIIAPRKIPALITLFDRAGGDLPVQKGYARDPRHLVLLNGFQLQVVQVQERPSTPQIAKAPEIPIPPLPVSVPASAPPIAAPASVGHTSAPTPSPVPITHAPSPAAAASANAPQLTSAPQLQPPPSSVPQLKTQPPTPTSTFPQPSQQGPHVPGLSPASSASASGPPPPAPTTLVQSLQQTIPSLPMPPTQQPGPPQPTQVPQPPQGQVQQQIPPNPMPFRNPRPIAARTMLSQQAANQQIANQLAQQQLNQQQLKAQLQALQQQQQQQSQAQQQPGGGPGQQMQQMVGHVGQQMGQSGQLGQQQTPQQHLSQQQAQMGQQQINLQQQMANQQNQLLQAQQQRYSSQMAAQQAMQQQQQHQERMGVPGGPMGQAVSQMQQQTVTSQQLQTQRAPEIVRVLNQPPIAASQSPPTQLGLPGLPQLPSQQPNIQKERRNIWSGLLEWHEKLKGPPDGQKVPRQVPCQVSANVVNNQPEVNGDGWPAKLIMQLIPKAIVGNLGGSYFMDVKTVLFMLQQCDALASLTRVMESGFAGCVHFTGSGTGSCDIKVLILLYSKERCAYLGFIPNDQIGFVDRIRKVIQQQKTQQASLRQGQGQGQGGGFPGGAGTGIPPRMMGMGVGGQQLLSQQLQQPPQQLQGQQLQPGQQQMQLTQQQLQAAGGQQLQQQRQGGPGQIAAQLGQQQQQLQAMLSQQQQQPQSQGMSQQQQAGGDLDPRELERQRNVLEIQQLQLQLQAARQRELELQQQQMQSGGQMTQGPGPQNPMQGQQQMGMASMGVGGQQQMPGGQQQMGFPGLQQQQQRQQLLQQQQQRGQRPTSMQQTNPGLKSLLQQQSVNVGPQFRAGGPMAARMAGMQGMHNQQQGQQQSQDQQQQQGQQMPPQPYDDVRILDLLR